MNREELIRMAREAGCKPFRSPEHWDDVQVFSAPDVLENFATLVAAAEREACARVAETTALDDLGSTDDWPEAIAAAIRARGNE